MKEESKPSGKTYMIDSLEKLVNVVTVENFDRLSVDFMMWLGGVASVAEHLRKELPEETKDQTNFELINPSFEWIDDGKNEHIGTRIVNETTGEVHIIEHKNDNAV